MHGCPTRLRIPHAYGAYARNKFVSSASVRKHLMVATSLLIFKCNLTAIRCTVLNAIESAITSSWYADLFIGRLGSWSPNVPLAMTMSLRPWSLFD